MVTLHLWIRLFLKRNLININEYQKQISIQTQQHCSTCFTSWRNNEKFFEEKNVNLSKFLNSPFSMAVKFFSWTKNVKHNYLTGVTSSFGKSCAQKVISDCPQISTLCEKFLTSVVRQNRNGNLEKYKTSLNGNFLLFMRGFQLMTLSSQGEPRIIELCDTFS